MSIFFLLLNPCEDLGRIRGHLILLWDSRLRPSTYWVVLGHYYVRSISRYPKLLRQAILSIVRHILIWGFYPASYALIAAQVLWELRLIISKATLNYGGVWFHRVVIRYVIDDRPLLYIDIIGLPPLCDTKSIDLILWAFCHIFEFIWLIKFFVLTCWLSFMAFWSIAPFGVLSHLISK